MFGGVAEMCQSEEVVDGCTVTRRNIILGHNRDSSESRSKPSLSENQNRQKERETITLGLPYAGISADQVQAVLSQSRLATLVHEVVTKSTRTRIPAAVPVFIGGRYQNQACSNA